MKTGIDLDQPEAYVTGGTSPLLHLSPTCPAVKKAKRHHAVRTEDHPNNVVCQRCDPDVNINRDPGIERKDCRECGATLNDDGDCEWCANFEAVMADAPERGEHEDPVDWLTRTTRQANGDHPLAADP